MKQALVSIHAPSGDLSREISGLAIVLLLYFWMACHALAKAARSGWKWNYCLGAGALIVFAGAAILLFLRSTGTSK